jgi:hypothetical protein
MDDGHRRADRIKNIIIRDKIWVAPIVRKIVESHLR